MQSESEAIRTVISSIVEIRRGCNNNPSFNWTLSLEKVVLRECAPLHFCAATALDASSELLCTASNRRTTFPSQSFSNPHPVSVDTHFPFGSTIQFWGIPLLSMELKELYASRTGNSY